MPSTDPTDQITYFTPFERTYFLVTIEDGGFYWLCWNQEINKQALHKKVNKSIYKILSVPYVSANLYWKSRNLPNTDLHYYSTDLR